MSNDFYTDIELEALFGKRVEGIPLFDAFELGWACPKNSKHRITYSEFRDHIWCYDCKKDFFSLLCKKQMNPFTTENILKEEIELLKAEMATWTLQKYRELGGKSKPETTES